jgi:hypothetical protein
MDTSITFDRLADASFLVAFFLFASFLFASFFSAAPTAPDALVYATAAVNPIKATFPDNDAYLFDANIPAVIFSARACPST